MDAKLKDNSFEAKVNSDIKLVLSEKESDIGSITPYIERCHWKLGRES